VAIRVPDIAALPEYAQRLLQAARDVAPNSYNPYSDYIVGAAVAVADGTVFVGAFFENASYGMTICAEPAAVLAANSAGKRDIRTIAVVGGPHASMTTSSGQPCTPCGRCRQILAELAHLNGREIEVYAADLSLTSILLLTSEELLPYAFGPDHVDRAIRATTV